MTAQQANAPETAPSPSGENSKPKEYNSRWISYVYIMFSSLVCLASISNIKSHQTIYPMSLSIGCITFGISIIVLVVDRFHITLKEQPYHKILDGKLEGSLLLFFVLWWIIGVSVITRAGGVAYEATNIYLSSWLSLGACVHALNWWSGSMDIVTLRELTRLSTTLSGWYALFFSSLVVLGSAGDLYSSLELEKHKQVSDFTIFLGCFSTIVSAYFILVHYRFVKHPKLGGWAELVVAFFMLLFWTIGVSLVTSDDGIAPSVTGQCAIPVQDSEKILFVPGSNLYAFSWLAFLSSLHISLQWKAAQALSFAQTAQQSSKLTRGRTVHEGEDAKDAGDEVDDEEYEDAEEEVI